MKIFLKLARVARLGVTAGGSAGVGVAMMICVAMVGVARGQDAEVEVPPLPLFRQAGAKALPVVEAPPFALAEAVPPELSRAAPGIARQGTALQIIRREPALAGAVTAALLQWGEGISPSLAEALLKLPQAAVLAAVSAHAGNPAALDSPLLRAAAASSDTATASAALALLAGRHSIKNNTTLDALSVALASRDAARITAVLDNFESDSEFARMPRWSIGTGENTSDKFGGGGAGSVLVGMTPADLQPERRRVSAHIPSTHWPDVPSMLRFLGVLEKVASEGGVVPVEKQNQAYEIVLTESASPRLPSATMALLKENRADSKSLAQRIALRYTEETRLLELVLQSLQKGECRFERDLFPRLAPFLVRDTMGERSRLLARVARQLVQSANNENRVIGLIFLAAHGSPGDVALLTGAAKTSGQPALHSPDPVLRRAAVHALSRLAPELFMLRLSDVAADPDASIRVMAPLTFHKTGYRWEHRPAPATAIAEWVPPPEKPAPAALHTDLLDKLASDPDAAVRLATRMARLQHGLLAAGDTLADLAAPEDTPLPSARLFRAGAAARADGRNVPAVLAPYIPPPDVLKPVSGVRPPTPVLAVFGPAIATALDESVAELRRAMPEARVVRFFNGTAEAARMRKAFAELFQGSAAATAPMLVFSSGAWFATDTAPDFALLREIASLGTPAWTPRRVEKLLLPLARKQTHTPAGASDGITPLPLIDLTYALERNLGIEEESFFSHTEIDGHTLFILLLAASVALSLLFLALFRLHLWYKARPDRLAEAAARAAKTAKPEKD